MSSQINGITLNTQYQDQGLGASELTGISEKRSQISTNFIH